LRSPGPGKNARQIQDANVRKWPAMDASLFLEKLISLSRRNRRFGEQGVGKPVP
jgi:hypothetical protein